jgi:hypothetical protein
VIRDDNLIISQGVRLSKQLSSYSARPDGKLSLHDIIKLIPASQRQQLEDDFNLLFDEGYGELTLTVVKGEIDTWETTISRKVNK